ncbi:hypothetical protein QVD17_13449 [Tagetes erecta]|uniref:Protein MIZU-KUSSEI 1 n=1 Tax=Tagetes erecta TaxID=13708 RepID=A0AAD8P3G3_TARER|nr:hypothetical protein QVD17_13449 [Tagetes erecta]
MPPSSSPSKQHHPPPPPPPPPSRPPTNRLLRSSYRRGKNTKVFRVVRSVFRSFPVVKHALPGGRLPDGHRANCVTGTLYGYREGRVTLAIQENPKTLPIMILELELTTDVLQNEMSLGMVRIALECEKHLDKDNKVKLLEEPLWTMFFNGKKGGVGVKRDATEEDLHVIELLRQVMMGAGVLPEKVDVEGSDGELAYMRAHFDRVVGSKDSETLYMLSPDGNNGPELSIFFVRI